MNSLPAERRSDIFVRWRRSLPRRVCCPSSRGTRRINLKSSCSSVSPRLSDAADVGACRVHQLLRSTADGKVYDALPEVAARYSGQRTDRKQLAIWKPNRKVRFMRPGEPFGFRLTSRFGCTGRLMIGIRFRIRTQYEVSFRSNMPTLRISKPRRELRSSSPCSG